MIKKKLLEKIICKFEKKYHSLKKHVYFVEEQFILLLFYLV